MVKRRKRASLKGKDATKVRVVKDPNPDSEDFMYDAIDKFHNGEEKIMLNPNTEEVEEDGLKMDLGDEVMALKGDSSSDEDDDDDDDEEDDGDDDGDGEGKKVNDEDFDGGDMDIAAQTKMMMTTRKMMEMMMETVKVKKLMM